MVRLRTKKHRGILYDKIVDALGGQISDSWQKRMFERMVGQTRFRPVEELKGGRGWKLEGQNVHHVIIDARGHKYIGPATVYVPTATLEKLKGLESKDRRAREAAEKALHTVSHELAHDYFKVIDYEARMTRYLRDNTNVAEKYLSRLLTSSGKFRGADAREVAKERVRKNPLFWANYLAHTAHEAGADVMAAETVTRVAEGRHARARDLDRLTALRPFTVREMARLGRGNNLSSKKPRKPSMLERMSRGLEHSSWEFMRKIGGLNRVTHPTEARVPPRSFAARAIGRARRRAV